MRYIFLLLVFVFMVFYLVKDSDKHMKKMNKYVDNSIIFEGQVNRIQASNNHAFGILELKIIQSNVKGFDQKIRDGMYPYKIKNGDCRTVWYSFNQQESRGLCESRI